MEYNKGIFKWAGSKQKMLPNLLPILEKYKKSTFVEPFVGAANVSLNFDTDQYIWNDSLMYLYHTYQYILSSRYAVEMYNKSCQEQFNRGYDAYYDIRQELNSPCYDILYKLSRFQYLNKFGFNGLCRFNKKGEFNTPIGTIKKNLPQVPYDSIVTLWDRHTDNTVVHNKDFKSIFKMVEDLEDVLIYNDSPYVPLTTDFKYTPDGFNKQDHIDLKELSKQSPHTAIISNHWTKFTEDLYSDADEIHLFEVQRTISCKGSERKKVKEVVAVYYSS